jgi:hypothetical protein
MSERGTEGDPERDEGSELEAEEELDDAPRNPFDNPWFLPVLLLGLSLWFGYDGWLNADEHMQKYQLFNRVGFGLLVAGGLWFLWRARKERREKAGPGG